MLRAVCWSTESLWLAYRVRRPLDEGRGVSVAIARSTDGVRFDPVDEVGRDAFGAASFERPVIMPTGSGWRVYLAAQLRSPSIGGSRL